jgi:4-amino-4-deoxy-L-arabinose transferase-like glycosyltransferase
MRNFHANPWFSLLALALLAIALRWGSFFHSVINHDESTYIVIAGEMLRGATYLKDVIDTKPIGIFWIYAALIKLTGGSIPALRLAATLVVALGGWGLYWAGRRATGNTRIGLAAGMIYCFVSTIFTYYGLSPNTEIFFNTLTIAAVALAIAPRARSPKQEHPGWHWPVAGFLLGAAVVIKPFVAAEALAIGLFLVWFYARQGKWLTMVLLGVTLVLGFLLPLAGVYYYYDSLDLLEELAFYSWEVSRAYPVELPWHLRLLFLLDYLGRFSPFVILGGGALVQAFRQKATNPTRIWGTYLLLQFVLVAIMVIIPGKRFGHYQIQLHPVLCLMAALWWLPGMKSLPFLRTATLRRWAPTLIIVPAIVLGTVFFFKYQHKEDQPAEIVAYLKDQLGPTETFLPLNGFQITYHLLDRPVPTPYVHSSLLFLPHHVRAFQIDERAEAQKLLANPNLTLLVGRTKDEWANTPLTEILFQEFEPYDTIGEKLRVWRRKQ